MADIKIKTSQEINLMAEGGKILSAILAKTLTKAAPGISTRELDKYAQDLILAAGGKPSFKMEKGYYFTTCMCVNDIVVHGIPTDYRLKNGDILGVDAGVFYKGFHTDASWTKAVNTAKSKASSRVEKFLATGEAALDRAIGQCMPGNHVGDISKTIQETVEGAGYSVVRQLVGHGVGRDLHENPEIPGFVRGRTENTPKILPGMVFAVEVIYNYGGPQVVYGGDDGWTIVTRDGSPSGLFEHTVAITDRGPEILTPKRAF